MHDFRYYINLTEAAYDGLVARLKRQHSDQQDVVDQQLAWAKSIFAKSDQITWYLKIIDAYLKHQLDQTLLGDYQFTSLDQLQLKLSHYFGYQSPEISNHQFGTKTVSDVVAELDALERKWQAKQTNEKGVDPQEGDYPLFEFKDGTKWWFIDRSYCSQEGRSGLHCGNVAGLHNPDQRILSLRNSRNQVILTFILEPNRTLGEMKTKGNQKPQERYHPHIMQLLLWPEILPSTINASDRGIEIAGISGQGYMPDMNFSVFDLDNKHLDLIEQKKPSLIKDQAATTPHEILRTPAHIRDQYADVAIERAPGLQPILANSNNSAAWIQGITETSDLIIYFPQRLWSEWPEFEDRLIETLAKSHDLLLRAPKSISRNSNFLSKLIDRRGGCIIQVVPTVKNYQELALKAVSQIGGLIYYVQDPNLQVQLAAVKQNPFAIKYIKDPSEQVQLAAIDQNLDALDNIKNPTERVQLAAVQENPRMIQLFEFPSEQVQLTAVKLNGFVIRSIKDPSEQVQLAAVKTNGTAIQFIKNPSEQVQLAAVQQHYEAIRYINSPSEKIQLAAINQDVNAIYYISSVASEQIQLAAVQKDPDALRLIHYPSEQVQLAAIKQDFKAIKLIENPSEQVQLAAIKQNTRSLELINDPSEQIQLAAIKQDFRAIKWIADPSEQIQLAAVSQNGYAISYLKNKNPSEQVQLAAVKQNPDAIRFIVAPSQTAQLAVASATSKVAELTESARILQLTRRILIS